MKLVFNATTIFDDAAGVYASDLTVNGELLTQRVDRLRATNASFNDRGNAHSEIRFSVSRSWSSYREAQEHYLTHAQTVNGKASAVFTLGSGGDTSTLTGAGAILIATGVSYRGLSTRFNYTLQAPSLSLS